LDFKKYDKHGGYHWRQYVRGDKYRTHADFIKSWVKEKRVLDIGAGDGVITYLLGADGIEYEQTAVDIAKVIGVKVEQGDAYDLGDREYEAVTMFDVLEHFDHPEKALAEAHRVAPVIYISTPERGMVNDPYHVREWVRDELPIFMRENGWELTGELIIRPELKCMYGRFERIVSHP
jgi:2-polyprenyl-3-methyl-5-hydroxy-6-metoxy-1,4-benzoquinol methylase